MSVGNINSNGDKGNNFPWQIKVLQGLQTIIDDTCCKDSWEILSEIRNLLLGTTRTPLLSETSSTGSTVAGAYSVSIANIGSATGTVEGVSLPAGGIINMDGGALNNTLNPILYDATGTTFLVINLI